MHIRGFLSVLETPEMFAGVSTMATENEGKLSTKNETDIENVEQGCPE